jgi:Cu+-exporting ATPase
LEEVENFESTTGGGVSGRMANKTMLVGQKSYLESKGVSLTSEAESASNQQAQGQTLVFVAVDGQYAGVLALADPIKPTTCSAIDSLHIMKIKVVMLTGDNARTARQIADQLQIDEVVAEVSPQGKQEKITALKSKGERIAMAGDGVNDAPALAAADVGIAMGSGTDVAMESAGITLVKGDLRGIVTAIALSRATMSNIRQNLFFAFVYNGIGIPIAAGALYPAFGILLNPMIASAAMSLSSVSVIGNALRLRYFDAK